MFPVIFGVELGDYGETKDDLVFMFGMSVEPDKVVDHLPVGLTYNTAAKLDTRILLK